MTIRSDKIGLHRFWDSLKSSIMYHKSAFIFIVEWYNNSCEDQNQGWIRTSVASGFGLFCCITWGDSLSLLLLWVLYISVYDIMNLPEILGWK